MNLRIALFSNPIKNLNPKKDTSLLLCQEAQDRGCQLYHFTPESLFLDGVEPKALGNSINLNIEEVDYYNTGDKEILNLIDFDVILIRHNPPFDEQYITATYLMEKVAHKVFFANHPTTIRTLDGKVYIIDFPDFITPTLIGENLESLEYFYKKHNDIILKPLNAFGGQGITRIRPEEENLEDIFNTFKESFPHSYMVQKYIPEAVIGDKRIILFDGEPVSAILRVPSDPDKPANISLGASVEPANLTKREEELCKILGPQLREKGLFFVGVDMLGDYLTEINMISPGTILSANKAHNINLEKIFWDKLEQKI